jgi:hypothetical protein
MKKQLFLYLFVFAVSINLFTYMYFTGEQKHNTERLDTVKKQLRVSRDSLAVSLSQGSYFSLENDNNALAYLRDNDVEDVKAFTIKVTDGILAKNANPKGNPLVGYESFDQQKYVINKVKLLNHRWAIADFNNNKQWGEVLIRYFINEDGSIDYETGETLLYPTGIN